MHRELPLSILNKIYNVHYSKQQKQRRHQLANERRHNKALINKTHVLIPHLNSMASKCNANHRNIMLHQLRGLFFNKQKRQKYRGDC